MIKSKFKVDTAPLFFLMPLSVTIAINPWSSLDPINLPKLLILIAFVFALSLSLAPAVHLIWRRNKTMVFLLTVFVSFMVVSTLKSRIGILDSFWGEWGRNTGSLTYLGYVCCMLLYALYSFARGTETIFRSFVITGYFVSGYTWLQLADLDPISWSQKAPVATLGNINFMSGFLGMTSILMVSYIFDSHRPVAQRAHYLTIVLSNVVLIWISGSIQGLAILLSGVTILLFFKLFSRQRILAWLVFILSLLSGLIFFLGTAGVGPLSGLIKQETVIYRLDYWRAGWRMFVDNPILGLGPDAYGDFYRLYRDLAATTRTGPQRVTNTAHNVFLDLASGSGIFVVLSFTLILLTICLKLARQNCIRDVNAQALLAIIAGWIVFMTVSIGQIGVNVWGFTFLGLAIGLRLGKESSIVSLSSQSEGARKTKGKKREISPKFKGMRSVENEHLEFSSKNILKIFLSGVMGLSIAIAPFYADQKFLLASRAKDLEGMKDATNLVGSSPFHTELLLDRLNEVNAYSQSLEVARRLVEEHPRSWRGWVEIALNPISSQELRLRARAKLIELDPNNIEVRNP